MTILATNHRNKLERVIIEAREVAETGARAALESLAVHHHEYYRHMTADEQKLRNRLRAHGRQLDDHYDSKKGTQAIDHLVNECAYEHWHRMLFARFLAENDLLIEPEMGVAISLEECEDLAKEQNIDSWVLASRYAQQMLPQIFRPDDPVLQVTFAPEHLLKLERLLESLEPEVFTASDAIGWVYQFWQSKKKEEVNRSEKKIGADELPAVTQLFTEPYMVSFLIHNTLGAWYAGKVFAANPDLARNAENEEALRNALALPGVTWDYLRFIRHSPSPATGEGRGEGDGIWQPAAGIFDGWPKKAAELKVLDPCCGSGHFLVAVFMCLVALRMAEERISAKEACNAVLRENIFGLDIDERCTQIAVFSLALATWRYPNAGGFRRLPNPHIACSGLPVSRDRTSWEKLAEGNHNMRIALQWMYDEFKNAPTLGSLLNTARSNTSMIVELPLLQDTLEQALAKEESDETAHELGIVAQGLAKAAKILTARFTLVITNVPYLGRGKQDDVLMDYCKRFHPESKADLATCFIERCLNFCNNNGTASLVTPQNWLFQHTYKELRKSKLQAAKWNFVTKLGPNAFHNMNWWRATTALLILTNNSHINDHIMSGLDVTPDKYPSDKQKGVIIRGLVQVNQLKQLENPDAIIVLEVRKKGKLLGNYGRCIQGVLPADRSRLVKLFWEMGLLPTGWEFFQGSDQNTDFFNGRYQIFSYDYFKNNFEELGGRMQGTRAFGKIGISISKMRNLPVTIYSGKPFDGNAHAFIVNDPSLFIPLWSFLSSMEFCVDVRKIDQKGDVTNSTIDKVPFDLDHWQKVAEEKYPNGLPKPYSDNPTQWIYHGHPAKSEQDLQVAVARLLGYRWPAELDPDMELADEQRQWVNKSEALLHFADDDGIVCIPSLRGEDAATERLRALLAAAYGAEWSPAKERELVTSAQATDLDDWLRNYFFEQHCQLFHNRPFVWHIWDGRKRDGFHALVNYHKLAEAGGKGRQLLEKLTYGYLGDWITLQKDGVKQGIGGADDRLAAALELEKRLKAILEGEPPFDIFVRWKPIEQQPIGWEPDINDGVRLNIRPFMADDIPGGKRGAGILRCKPNIKWDKDRGKDVASAPWFDLGSQCGGHSGDRINDHHLTCEEKRKA